MGEKVLSKNLSISEYLRFEEQGELRHEFHNGEIFATTGGTRNHSIIGTNLLTELNLLGRQAGCTTFNGDVKIYVETSKRFLYPEASLVCGNIQSSPHDPESVINPILIAEVLSDTTEAYDRGEKFRLYRSLPAFREYLLLDQHRPIVSIFSRQKENIWEMREIVGLDQQLVLQSFPTEKILMQDLYRNTLNLDLLREG
jgi:Uma2 family endonuclease